MQKLQLLNLCALGSVSAHPLGADPLGRKAKLPFTLLDGQDAYEPETQSRAWMTMDESVDRLDGEARAEFMSPVLVSDMKAFRVRFCFLRF